MPEAQYLEAVRKNYSKAGTALIEQLYGDNFLSLSGECSSDNIIRHTNINTDTRLLDIGSGVGGPAIYFAQKTGCTVTGVDIVEWNVDEANKRSRLARVDDKVAFQVGDATSLTFDSGTFDVAISQDAWCHIPEKRRVISEAVRMVKSGGFVAFTDWIELAAMESKYLAEVQTAVAAANFSKPQCYKNWLLEEGCTIISIIDISQHFADRYRTMISNLKLIKSEIVQKYNQNIFSIILEKNELILQAFTDGKIGGTEIVAQKQSYK